MQQQKESQTNIWTVTLRETAYGCTPQRPATEKGGRVTEEEEEEEATTKWEGSTLQKTHNNNGAIAVRQQNRRMASGSQSVEPQNLGSQAGRRTTCGDGRVAVAASENTDHQTQNAKEHKRFVRTIEKEAKADNARKRGEYLCFALCG